MKTRKMIYTVSLIIMSTATATASRFDRSNASDDSHSSRPAPAVSRSLPSSSPGYSAPVSARSSKTYSVPSRTTSRSFSPATASRQSQSYSTKSFSGRSSQTYTAPGRNTAQVSPAISRKPSVSDSAGSRSSASRNPPSHSTRTYTPKTPIHSNISPSSSSGSSRTYTPPNRSVIHDSTKQPVNPVQTTKQNASRFFTSRTTPSQPATVKQPAAITPRLPEQPTVPRMPDNPGNTSRIYTKTRTSGHSITKSGVPSVIPHSSKYSSQKTNAKISNPLSTKKEHSGFSKAFSTAKLQISGRKPHSSVSNTQPSRNNLSRFNTDRSNILNKPSYYNPYHDRHYASDHYHSHPPYRHNNWSRPVWRSPVIYPAGFGLTWANDSFSISFSTYRPVRYNYYTPYYNSCYYGGYGYTSLYYGGWRYGWYGGLSYVCNPWPVYRTYYLYEPEPVIIKQPVIVRQETVVERNPAQELQTTTTELQAAPISYAAGYPADYTVVEERTTIRPVTATDTDGINTAAFDPEYVYEDQFDPFYYDGDFLNEELQIGFSSYASTLNPESIWFSYAQMDTVY